MYLSYLLIDTAADPSHPRPGRAWVRNPYRVHQRLCMAFPSDKRRERDEEFIDRFLPDEFIILVRKEREPDGRFHVHQVRGETAGFLFRIDMVGAPLRAAGKKAAEWRGELDIAPPSRHMMIVQSAIEPDWKYAFHNAREFLCAEPIVKPYEPEFAAGQKRRFILRANPTKRLRANSPGPDGRPLDPKWIGKRVGLYAEDEQRKWLDRHAAAGGFKVLDVRPESDDAARYLREYTTREREVEVERSTAAQKEKADRHVKLTAVRFEGTLEVTKPAAFRTAVIAGIGPGKGFGFGLLSLAPVGG